MANREERIVFPSFCIYSFHIPYRRAIIFEKAFSQRENSTPSSFEDRKSRSNDVATHAFVAFPILSPVFDGAWRTKPSISRFIQLLTEEAISWISHITRLHSLTCNRKGIDHSLKGETKLYDASSSEFCQYLLAK